MRAIIARTRLVSSLASSAELMTMERGGTKELSEEMIGY